ncbi:MAG: Maf family nucleotide pyrophosphatase [Cellvibrionaceae bacterium]|nr:Maf family nucleotide pyrophosphatase [Cellvibrionaceae bacterium]
MKPKLLLASGSPYRRKQLEQLGRAFEWQAANIDETPAANESPAELAQRLGLGKARALAGRKNYLIIAGDQTAALNALILGKPDNAEQACLQLQRCAGQSVTFYSSICVLDSNTGNWLSDVIATEVTFRQLSERQIQRYVELEQPLDCAGSFKCEALGIALFDAIRSDDPSALIGLPLIRLTQLLYQFNYDILL